VFRVWKQSFFFFRVEGVAVLCICIRWNYVTSFIIICLLVFSILSTMYKLHEAGKLCYDWRVVCVKTGVLMWYVRMLIIFLCLLQKKCSGTNILTSLEHSLTEKLRILRLLISGGWNWLLKSEYHFTSAHKYALSAFQLVNIK